MFINAQPIWLKNKSSELNSYAVFRTKVSSQPEMELHITGATFYRVYVNDAFVGFGPARTALGYAREDIFSLNEFVNVDSNCDIVIEAVGYNCGSLSTVRQPSFVMAEVQCHGRVLAYTGKDFEGFLPECKVQKVERYSIQRHFSEVWDYRNFTSLIDKNYSYPIEVLHDAPEILGRRAPYPLYQDLEITKTRSMGTLTYDESLPYRNKYSWSYIPEEWGRFEEDEIEHQPYVWIQKHRQEITKKEVDLPVTLNKGEYAILDFGRIEVGFLKASIETMAESDVAIGFCEYYEGETFTFNRMNAKNALEYLFAEGDRREVMSFEPYTCRFVIVAVKEGSIRLNSFGIKTYMFDTTGITLLKCENKVLESICSAAIQTFAHNAVDLYMDCPSRERAGWLCDSYFTAKTEYALTGDTKVEDAFLENYRLYKYNGEYPKGILPMCYPSDKNHKEEYIPQWTMWYILEVEEYINKRGHSDAKEAFKQSIYDLLDFYKQYENEDGLLERLPNWNFVEWSEANSWTWDVNYPTNFLYAQVLECIWKLYEDEECLKRSNEVRKVAIEQSFNGTYFMDHAVRDENGKLCLQKDASEACQYYAVLFGGIDIHSEEYKELKHLILNVFTPRRAEDVMPEIFQVNAFIGAYLRLETLCKMKEYELLLKDVEDFFGEMDERTGTLWEYRELKGSQDHGFASYAYVVVQEALTYLKSCNTEE